MAIAPNPLQAFIWGRGGAALTPEQVAREREIAEALMKEGADYSPVGHWLQGAARLGNTLSGKIKEGRAASQEAEGRAAYKSLWDSAFGGGGQSDVAASLAGSPATSAAMATTPAPDYASARVAQAHGDSTAPAVNLSESKQAFISNLLPAAIEESKRTGVDPRIIVAQAAQETGWGRSAPGNNYFGIKSHGKGGGQSFKTHEYVNGKRVNITDSFRRFDSPADSVRGYGDFILQNPRYRSLREAQGLDAQLAALQASGYATDPNYSKSVGAIARGIQIPDAIAANEAMASGSLAGVPVAETQQDILAQEDAMAAQDPMAFQQPSSGMSVDDPMLVWDAQGARMSPSYQSPRQHPNSIPYSGVGAQSDMPTALPEPRMVSDMPVADIAQSLTNATVNPDLPLAGGTQGFAPLGTQAPNVSLPEGASFSLPDPSMAVAQSLAAQPQQQGGGMPNMQQLMQLASDPWANDAQRQVAAALMKQQMEQNDPMRQLEMQKAQLEIEAMRNPRQKPIEVGGVLLDPSTMQPIFDSRDNTPSNVREYEYYANAEKAAGRQPMPFGDWDLSRRGASATQISNVVGGESDAYTKKFNESMGAAQAKTFTDAMEAGDQAQRNRINIDRLSQLARTTPQGFQGAIINTLGEFGIPTEGLDKVQAMESLISQLVPTQRPPGSGTISDADLKLYKASLPRLINTPEGNKLILETMYAINDHDIAASEIASRVAAGELTPAEARKQMRAIPNPFDDWQDRVNASQGRDEQNSAPVAGSIVDGYRFKGGDPANPKNWEKQ